MDVSGVASGWLTGNSGWFGDGLGVVWRWFEGGLRVV